MFCRQFRLSEEDKQEVAKQNAEMEKFGIIEETETSWYNSSVFVVKKKDGSKRFVVDLRGINSLIVPRLVQLPNIDELLQSIVEKKPHYLSLIDLRQAYWQLKIEENFRKYTAFCGPDGRRWQFRRAPYGLSTSPEQWLGVLGKIFADRNKYHSIAIYMDDLSLYTNKFNDHIEQLKLTLSTLRENRFSCNLKRQNLNIVESNIWGLF